MSSRSSTPSASSSRQGTPSKCPYKKCALKALGCPQLLKIVAVATLVFTLVAISFQLPQEGQTTIPGYDARFEKSMQFVTYLLIAAGVAFCGASFWYQKYCCKARK